MSVKENLTLIHGSIHDITQSWNRAPDDIHLVAVSKRQPQEKIQDALDAGHRLFGENRVQEAFEHWEGKKALYPDLKLHLIGPLQTNKVADALSLFDVIETLDRPKLARKLQSTLSEQGRVLPCFVQVNIGEEPQKSGILPKDLPEFLSFCRAECPALHIRGLMCIPPFDEPCAPYFALLRDMAKTHDLPALSMGMSGDYAHAIALGATHVRVGTGIFGAREG